MAGRVANRVQLITDGHRMYLDSVDYAFGSDVDYAMLVKHYGSDPEDEKRYSPAECVGAGGHRSRSHEARTLPKDFELTHYPQRVLLISSL